MDTRFSVKLFTEKNHFKVTKIFKFIYWLLYVVYYMYMQFSSLTALFCLTFLLLKKEYFFSMFFPNKKSNSLRNCWKENLMPAC